GVRPLCARKDHGGGRHSGNRRCETDLHALMAREPEAGPSMVSATPIAPQQGGGADLKRMKQQTDATRVGCGMAMPLALQTLEAITTVADASAVEHAQAAIVFAALFRGTQGLALWTEQRPIRPEREVLRRRSALPSTAMRRWARHTLVPVPASLRSLV